MVVLDNTKDSKNPNTNSSSAQIATSAMSWMAGLMFIQFATRMVHFILNLIIVRFMTPEEMGISALQLPFITTIVSRILKEALHRLAVRERDSSSMVLVWLSIPIGIVTSLALAIAYYSTSLNFVTKPWLVYGLALWMVASWMEMALEPILISLERHLIVNATVVIEILALIAHAITVITLLMTINSYALIQSYGHFLYTLSLFLGYYYFAFVHRPEIGKSIWPDSFQISRQATTSVRPFLIQSIGKWVTAEGCISSYRY